MRTRMYTIQINFERKAILVPKDVIDALGPPPEINVILHPGKGILGITGEILYEPSDDKQRGRPRRRKRTEDYWDEAEEVYRIDCSDLLLHKFSLFIPAFSDHGKYVLAGDKAGEFNAVLFELGKAVMEE